MWSTLRFDAKRASFRPMQRGWLKDLLGNLDRDIEAGAIRGGEDTGLFMRLTVLARLVTDFHDRLIKPEGLLPSEYQVLGLLRVRGARRPRDLQAAIGQTSAGVTNLLDRLEKRGLVARQTAPDDGRAIQIVATRAGLKLAEELEALESRHQKHVLEQLSQEQKRTLKKDLDALLEALLRS